jgi:hypothetical protein
LTEELADTSIVRSYRYGADRDSNEDTPKYIQALCYARAPHNHPDSNQYAYPLPFSPRYNINTGQVVSIDPLATGGTEDGLAYHTTPTNGSMAHLSPNEYYPDLQSSLRQDLKPLQVVQPEGPSFIVTDGNLVQWQKWSFRIGFNYREGTTIHNVRYAGRKLFYRLSVSEMTVPYVKPIGARVIGCLRHSLTFLPINLVTGTRGVHIIENKHLISEMLAQVAVRTTWPWDAIVWEQSNILTAGLQTTKANRSKRTMSYVSMSKIMASDGNIRMSGREMRQ